MRISATVITLNEERHIAEALESLAWADEIVVVDSGSTDRTAAIAEGKGARVIQQEFLGYAGQQAFNAFRSAFLQTMQGFGEAQDARILNRQPVRLDVKPVSRPATLRDLLPRNLPAPFTPEEVAIINQLELNQEIPAGRIVKIPTAG